jgi:hypothetical protein
MPFKSEAQWKWMYANEPNIAKKWEKHAPKEKKPQKRKGKFTGIVDKGYMLPINQGQFPFSLYF